MEKYKPTEMEIKKAESLMIKEEKEETEKRSDAYGAGHSERVVEEHWEKYNLQDKRKKIHNFVISKMGEIGIAWIAGDIQMIKEEKNGEKIPISYKDYMGSKIKGSVEDIIMDITAEYTCKKGCLEVFKDREIVCAQCNLNLNRQI